MSKRIAAQHRTGPKGLPDAALHEHLGNRAEA